MIIIIAMIGADVNIEDRYGNTPFDDAIRENQLVIANR